MRKKQSKKRKSVNMKPINQVFLKLIKAYFHNETVTIQNINIDEIYELALKHNLVPIIYESLRKNTQYPIPAQFMQTAISQIVGQQQRTEQFFAIYQKLLDANIKPLVLKGLVCRELYPQSDYRISSDEDIWIQPQDFEQCYQIFIDNQYNCTNKQLLNNDDFLQTVQTINFSNNILTVEVHINPFGTHDKLHQKMNSYFKNAFSSAVSMNINHQIIYTLEPTQHYLFLIIHLYKHFISAGVGIRQVLDLFIFYQHYQNNIDHKQLESILKSLKIDQLYLAIITIGKQYLGFENLPATKIIQHIDTLTENLISNGCFGTHDMTQAYSSIYTRIITRNKNTSVLKTIWQMIFPSVEDLGLRYPILQKKPQFYLWFALKRIFSFIKKIFTGQIKIFKLFSIGKKRSNILKDFDVFK